MVESPVLEGVGERIDVGVPISRCGFRGAAADSSESRFARVGDQLRQHQPQRIDVGARIERAAGGLLGRQIQRRALDQPRQGLGLRRRRFDDTKVGQFDRAASRQQDVVWSHVAMHEVEGGPVVVGEVVDVVQRLGDLFYDAKGVCDRQGLPASME